MNKSFREQMIVVLNERYPDPSGEEMKRYLAESTTPTAETLITYIRQWPEQQSSRNQALGRLLECDRWNDRGELTLEANHKGKPYPARLPLAMAYEWYQFGDQRRQFFPAYNFPSALKRIPANATEDWVEEIKGLFNDINRASVSAIKIISLGRCVKMLGVGNPHAYAQWNRQISEWTDAQNAINEFVIAREGWKHLTTENLQNPKHKAAMSTILEDILAKADEIVEPSVNAILEQDRRLSIRQDATGARNKVKGLQGFFKSYGHEITSLEFLSGMINDVEAHNLGKKI